jgi:uncharacterized membrane protein
VFAPNPVLLDPGQATTVNLTAGSFDFALPTSYPFGVAAVSQADSRVRDEAVTTVTFTGQEAVELSWAPVSQTVQGTPMAGLALAITNTGNVQTTYALSLNMPGLSGQLPVAALTIPARQSIVLPLFVTAASPGTYTISAVAASTSSSAGDNATASVTFDFAAPPLSHTAWLPLVTNGFDTTTLQYWLYLPLILD